MPSKRATTDVWTIRNTQDMRSYIDEMEDAVNDLQMLVWDSAHDRARRRVEAPEFFDCLAHLTWAMELLLTFTEKYGWKLRGFSPSRGKPSSGCDRRWHNDFVE